MRKNFIVGLACSALSTVAFVFAGVCIKEPAFTSFLALGCLFLSFTIKQAIKDHDKQNASKIISDKLDPDGIYEVCGISESRRPDGQGFILFLQDLKHNQPRVFWQKTSVPQGFREVKNGERTFFVSEEEKFILKMLPIYGLTV